jgi:hypothetical protein
MNRYRIKAISSGYVVEKRVLFFFWIDCNSHWLVDSPFAFDEYSNAKETLEHTMRDAAFKTRYYYPPLPDEEPVND